MKHVRKENLEVSNLDTGEENNIEVQIAKGYIPKTYVQNWTIGMTIIWQVIFTTFDRSLLNRVRYDVVKPISQRDRYKTPHLATLRTS